VPQYRIRDGATLSAANLEACLPYEQAFTASFPLFRDLRDKYGRPDLPFQVGIPGPLDLSVDAFGFEVGFDPRYYQPSFEATASQVNKIAAAGGSDVVFQLETPAALIAVASGDEAAARPTAQQVAGLTVQLPAAVPAGTRFGVHLCLGDLNHKSMVGMRHHPGGTRRQRNRRSLGSADRTLEFIHVAVRGRRRAAVLRPGLLRAPQRAEHPAVGLASSLAASTRARRATSRSSCSR
jgi:hypothetical protein